MLCFSCVLQKFMGTSMGTLIPPCGRVGRCQGHGVEPSWMTWHLSWQFSDETGLAARRTGWIRRVHPHALPLMHMPACCCELKLPQALIRCNCLISDGLVPSYLEAKINLLSFANHSVLCCYITAQDSDIVDEWKLKEPSIIYSQLSSRFRIYRAELAATDDSGLTSSWVLTIF